MVKIRALPALAIALLPVPTLTCQHPSHRASNYPRVTGFDVSRWVAAQSQADTWIRCMNLTEKSAVVTGTMTGLCIEYVAPNERLGFSGLCLQDGPAGIRLADLASVFPAGVTTAATWDKELMYQRGAAMAAEFRAKGAHVVLGPSAGPLGRSPWGGRNWESFSPDPYLTGIAMDYTIRAIQETGVQATAKHFIGNEQETQRKPTIAIRSGKTVAAISSNIDDRTLHELYLWPFADAVHAGVASVMCAYNRVNGTYSCENGHLLNGILKGELGFLGYVVSDFFATRSDVKAIQAGLDMNQPGPISMLALDQSYFGNNIDTAVQNHSLPMARVDDMVRRILTPFFYLGQDRNYPTIDPSSKAIVYDSFGYLSMGAPTPAGRDVRGNHSALIRQIGAAGTVLLKNDNSFLPLNISRNTIIGVFGNDAAEPTVGLVPPAEDGFQTGTLIIGGGSGSGRPSYIVTPLEAIKALARDTGARVQYILNNTALATGNFRGLYPWPDICLLFLKTWATEGVDRVSLEPDNTPLTAIINVAAMCPGRTVVITHSGGPNTMMPWALNPNISAILAAHYPGQESGHSIVDVLTGRVNPSGKLPYTIAREVGDYNAPIVNVTGPDAEDPHAWQCSMTEGLFIDYRHFDGTNITPLYEFGFGMSYTNFTLPSDSLHVSIHRATGLPAYPPDATNGTVSLGGNPNLWAEVLDVSCNVSNTGYVSGATVIQLYVSLPEAQVPQGTPVRVLRGFKKVFLDPGQTRKVTLRLRRRDVSYWDVVAQNWRIPDGGIGLQVGFSSRDLRARSVVRLI